MGLAIAQVVSPQPPITEKWFQSQVSLVGIMVDDVALGRVFL